MVLEGKTPYEVLHGKPPSYEHIRVFGSLCYAYNLRTSGDKFNSKSRRCIFVGYPYGKKGWRVYDLETRQFFVSQDVVFYENEFPYAGHITEASNPTMMTSYGDSAYWEDE